MFYVVILHPGTVFCDDKQNSWQPNILFLSKVTASLDCQIKLSKSNEMRIFETQENHKTAEREFTVSKSGVQRGFHKLLLFQAHKLKILQELQMTNASVQV